MPRTGEIIESALYVDDLVGAVAFYRDLFGFELALHDARMAVFRVNKTQVLLLFKTGGSTEPVETPGGVIPPNDGSGEGHVCFSVPEFEVLAWEQALADAGIALESRVEWEAGGQSLYFRDPHGNLLELKTTAWDGVVLEWDMPYP